MQDSYLGLTPKVALFSLCYFATKLEHCVGQDYWTEPDYGADSFDPNQDCGREEDIKRLMDMQPIRCEKIKIINAFDRNIMDGEKKAFSECKILLTIRVQKLCDFSRKKTSIIQNNLAK